MTIGVGFNETQWLPASHTPMGVGEGSALGETVWDRGKAYVRVKLDAASAAVARGDLVGISSNFDACLNLTTTTAATVGRAAKVGVALGAGVAGQVGWLQVYGPAPLNVAASIVANAALYTTATAGRVDDTATTGVLTGLRAPASTPAAVVEGANLNWPTLVSVA